MAPRTYLLHIIDANETFLLVSTCYKIQVEVETCRIALLSLIMFFSDALHSPFIAVSVVSEMALQDCFAILDNMLVAYH